MSFFLLSFFSDPGEAPKSLDIYYIYWTRNFLTWRNYYHCCVYATVVSIVNLKQGCWYDYFMRYYYVPQRWQGHFLAFLLLLFISTNIKVKISKAKQFKCTPLHFIRTSVGNTSLRVLTCYKNRYNFDIRKRLRS